MLEGVRAESLQWVLDEQRENQLGKLPLRCLNVFREHYRVGDDEAFDHLGLQMRPEGVEAEAGLVEHAA